MRLHHAIAVIVLTTFRFSITISQEQQALFIKNDVVESGKRIARQTSADQMVQNILQWLQGVYTQNSRRVRQGTLREYLPPTNTQKPRPFEPPSQNNQLGTGESFVGAYPPAGVTPRPAFTDGAYTGYTSRNQQPYPTSTGATGFSTTGFSTIPIPTDLPSRSQEFPSGSNVAIGVTTTDFSTSGYTNPTTSGSNFPNPSTGFSAFTTGFPSTTSGSIGFTTSYPRPYPTNAPQTTPSSNTFPTQSITTQTETISPFTSEFHSTTVEDNFVGTEEISVTTTTSSSRFEETSVSATADLPSRSKIDDEDLKHPPHIHAIDVECSKEMMTINIEFNRRFDGIIYSKGHYNNPECRYVNENSARTKYSFTVSLNSCGTQFINAFDTEGRSYLENVLVLQNEAGIQEVWDTIRAVRCLWEGNLKKALNVALSVGMLNQEIVTFSGDTAMARLDIQLGRGPFGPPANGLVKIGEVMTLVVSVTGDPGFDIQVKDCRAKDSDGGNVVALTDDKGCILKPKLFGAFQKTRNTGNTGASIMAYAFFNAFKFPDVMDLVLECNVDLCKTDCEMCVEPDQRVEPGRRRRRDLYSQNATNDNSVTMGKMLRVILPEDLNEGHTTISLTQDDGVCMSTQGFIVASATLISLLTSSCLFSAYIWLKYQRVFLRK